jgi:hypothetical protein
MTLNNIMDVIQSHCPQKNIISVTVVPNLEFCTRVRTRVLRTVYSSVRQCRPFIFLFFDDQGSDMFQ